MKLRFVFWLIIFTCNVNCLPESSISAPSDKVLIDIGDSLTYGYGGEGTTMSSVTSELLGNEWIVQNMGVGGENTITIGARYGAIPMYIKESITIPSDGSKVEIPTGLYSTYNDANISPLLQGDAGVNPCFINDVQCELTRSNGKYYVNRINLSTTEIVTSPESTITTALSKQREGIATIFIGQNGGYDTPEDLLNQIDLFVKHKGDENVIIITSHRNGFPEIVETITEKYGNKVIDLKTYMSTQGIYDAINYNLLPNDGSFPTSEDLIEMQNGYAPKSVLLDFVHFNAIGYELLGKLRYKKGIELGYW